MGVSVDQFIMGLIRKHEPIKQELKKLKKSKLISNTDMKYYMTLKQTHDNFLDNDYTDFDFEKAEKMEKPLRSILEDFKANDSWDTATSFTELILPTIESHTAFSEKIFSEATKAQEKILKFGELSNPIIYKYYSQVAIISEQLYINKEYEDNKQIEFTKEMSIEKYLTTYDCVGSERGEILRGIRDNVSQTFTNEFFCHELSPLKCAKLYQTKSDLMDMFNNLKLYVNEVINNTAMYKEGENDSLFVRHIKTLQNILETYENAVAYEFKKIDFKERQIAANNYSYKSVEGKVVFFKMHEALTQENIFSMDNLAMSLKISLEETQELISYYSSELAT